MLMRKVDSQYALEELGSEARSVSCEAFPIIPQAHLSKMASAEVEGLHQDVARRHRWVLPTDGAEVLFHRDLRPVVRWE